MPIVWTIFFSHFLLPKFKRSISCSIFTHFEWFKALWVCPLINYILSVDLIIKEGKLSERHVIDTLNVQSPTCKLHNLVKKIGGLCATSNVKHSTPIHIIHMYTLFNNITYIIKGSWVSNFKQDQRWFCIERVFFLQVTTHFLPKPHHGRPKGIAFLK